MVHHAPPPTKFAPPTAQAKSAPLLRAFPAPPPTLYGEAVTQAKPLGPAGLPGAGTVLQASKRKKKKPQEPVEVASGDMRNLDPELAKWLICLTKYSAGLGARAARLNVNRLTQLVQAYPKIGHCSSKPGKGSGISQKTWTLVDKVKDWLDNAGV